jgi:hypothetical protein
MKRTVALAAAALALLASTTASAQVMGADIGAASGMEAGDDGTGQTAFRRARTRLRASVLWQTEEGNSGMAAVAFVEVEPHTSFGGEVRYTYAFSRRLEAFGGATGTFVPHILFGGVAGATALFGKGDMRFFVEPSISALPFGTDLPTSGVLLWGLVSVGVRGDISSLVASNGEEK